jgi:hypothetical protein
LEELLRETSSDETPNILWTVKSTRKLAQELTASHHRISHEKVAQILRQNGYNLQGTRRNDENRLQPDRQSQFQYLENRISERLDEGQPVISVETRRRDPSYTSGDYSQPRDGNIDRVLAGEFPTGVYDPLLARESVNIETAMEAPGFTADSLLGWWLVEGQELYPRASCLFITADGCGSSQKFAWKAEIQKLSNTLGLPVEFCRFPPGTSKWNRPCQRLFSFISSHWKGESERDYEIAAKLLNPPEETRTMALGLRLDHSYFPPQTRSTEDERGLQLLPSEFHGDWNFTINPESFGPFRLSTAFERIQKSAHL